MILKWNEIVSGIYYVGVGCVLMATSVRYLYSRIRDVDKKLTFMTELEVKVPALEKEVIRLRHDIKSICTRLGIRQEEE